MPPPGSESAPGAAGVSAEGDRKDRKIPPFGDIGCHTFSTLPPFNIGNTVLGYGLGLASNSAVHPALGRRTVTMMGDGGFWHNGLTSGIANTVFNKNDGILVIMKNGYSSATGTQELPSSPQHSEHKAPDMSMERALEGIGVGWIKTVDNYRVAEVAKTLRTDDQDYPAQGAIAEGECQLERQRRFVPQPKQVRGKKSSVKSAWTRTLHRRSLLHPPVRLPDAHHQGQPGPAAQGPGGDGDRRLRRLRPVRRERACRGALPFLLSR